MLKLSQEMPRHDLMTQQSQVDHMAQYVAQNIDLTAIYNRHGTIQDAQTSTDIIEPNSLVFIEGVCTEVDSERELEGAFYVCQMLRDEYGLNSDEYRNYKNLLIEKLKPLLDEQDPPGSFLHFSVTEATSLLEKDCIIHYADYVGNYPDKDLTRKFEHDANNTNYYKSLLTMSPNRGIHNAWQQTHTTLNNWHRMHHVRENVAVHDIVIDSFRRLTSPHVSKTQWTEQGKLKEYLMYGTSHARSLTHKLEQKGIQVTRKDVRSLQEYEYIDKTPEDFFKKYPKRFAQAIFRATSLKIVSDELHEKLVPFVCSYIEAKDDSDDEHNELLDFAIHCLRLCRKAELDHEGAFVDFRAMFDPPPRIMIGGQDNESGILIENLIE